MDFLEEKKNLGYSLSRLTFSILFVLIQQMLRNRQFLCVFVYCFNTDVLALLLLSLVLNVVFCYDLSEITFVHFKHSRSAIDSLKL